MNKEKLIENLQNLKKESKSNYNKYVIIGSLINKLNAINDLTEDVTKELYDRLSTTEKLILLNEIVKLGYDNDDIRSEIIVNSLPVSFTYKEINSIATGYYNTFPDMDIKKIQNVIIKAYEKNNRIY